LEIAAEAAPTETRPCSHAIRAQWPCFALPASFTTPSEDALALGRLVIDACDRVHRANDLRAGPLAALLERLQALEHPHRFEQLLCVCTCDYAAYPGHSAAEYPKADRLRRARDAYAGTDVTGLTCDAALQARAQSIALALR
jgi:tRNA nucleotidyltransferase (CCA-adding enzyme)